MPNVSAYQRVVLKDGSDWLLYTPRWMHMIDGRVLRGEAVDQQTGATSTDQIVIPAVNIAANIAVQWTGDQFIDAPDLEPWSDQ